MSDLMANTREGDVDLTRFERTLGGKWRCRECGATGYSPQIFFGIRYAWWGDEHHTHPWECSSCDRAFTTAGGLSRHRRARHP